VGELPHDDLRAEGSKPDHRHVQHQRTNEGHEFCLLQRRPDPVRMADRDDHDADGDAEKSRRQPAGPEAS
jgi:hypothetical protein